MMTELELKMLTQLHRRPLKLRESNSYDKGASRVMSKRRQYIASMTVDGRMNKRLSLSTPDVLWSSVTFSGRFYQTRLASIFTYSNAIYHCTSGQKLVILACKAFIEPCARCMEVKPTEKPEGRK